MRKCKTNGVKETTAVEAATEKMFDGVARIYGKGMADDMVDEFAKRWAKSEGGQALIRGAAGMGGEGLEEVVSSLANPALKTIYNGKSLRENYSDLNLNDVVYEGMIGALLGNIGGAVNIAQTGRGNTQNYQQGNSRAFGGQMRSTSPADVLRNADLNTLYTAAESNAQRSVPYAAHTASVQQQRSTPYTNAPARVGTAGRSQTLSYADVFRQMQAEQERATESEYARYKELDRKFLDGSISEEEFDELRRLDNVWREVDVPGKGAGTDSDLEYARYKELKRKYLDGSISPDEADELWRLEGLKRQFNVGGAHDHPEYTQPQSAQQESIENTIKDMVNLEWSDLHFGMGAGGNGNTGHRADNIPVIIGEIDSFDKEGISLQLDNVEKRLIGLDHEVNVTITSDGKVWWTSGEESTVTPENIPGGLRRSYSYHNHPDDKTHFSFSNMDAAFFIESGQMYSRASDSRFEYIMRRTNDTVEKTYSEVYNRFNEIYRTEVMKLAFEGKIDMDIDGYHTVMELLSKEMRFEYERKEKR